MLAGIHVGQLGSFGSQYGPCSHSSKDKNCWLNTPLVRRPAGLSVEGVYDHMDTGNDLTIAVTPLETSVLELLFLIINPKVYSNRGIMAVAND